MKRLSTQEILDGIRKKNNPVLKTVYKDNYPVIENFVLKNSGSSLDAEDIFQDAIVIIYRKIKKNELNLDCSFGTYIFSVCKVLWYKELRNRKNLQSDSYDEDGIQYLDDAILTMKDDFDKPKLIQKHLMNMNSDCRKILMLFYSNVPLKEISKILGFSGENYAKKRKFICKEKLIELIKKDPRYDEVMDSD